MLRTLMKWGCGFCASFLFIWALSAIFHDSVSPKVWDASLGKFVGLPGSVIRHRSEGWADTVMGRHGLTFLGETALSSPGKKFLFWGDSYADSLQVEDGKRAVNLFNASQMEYKGAVVAGGGLGVADYYFDIPRYERLFPEVEGHVILLAGLQDITPWQYVDCHSRFLSDPWRFEASSCEPSPVALELAPVVNTLHLDFLHRIYRSILDHDFRFRVGAVAGAGKSMKKAISTEKLESAWRFLAKSLKGRTEGFLAFVYVPHLPAMANGQVSIADSAIREKELFQTICVEYGIGFIDLSQMIIDAYRESGAMPKGFFNSPPGSGHLNYAGHKLIAVALGKYFAGGTP